MTGAGLAQEARRRPVARFVFVLFARPRACCARSPLRLRGFLAPGANAHGVFCERVWRRRRIHYEAPS
eukprot:14260172-Alexandrium_andersonii.AAC.1